MIEPKLYENARKLVIEERRCSVAYMQQRFALGYTRASEVVAQLEADGVVGPHKSGTHLRDILIPKAAPGGAA